MGRVCYGPKVSEPKPFHSIFSGPEMLSMYLITGANHSGQKIKTNIITNPNYSNLRTETLMSVSGK